MRLVTRALLPVITGLILTGCSEQLIKDEQSGYRPLGAGARVALKQPLKIKPGKTRVFLQHGLVVPLRHLDHYWPSCNFEVARLTDHPQTIKAGEFSVDRLQPGHEQVVQLRPARVAGLQPVGIYREERSHTITRYYHFWLHSDSQPDVMRLTCRGGLADHQEAYFPSLQEIDHALGKVARLLPRP